MSHWVSFNLSVFFITHLETRFFVGSAYVSVNVTVDSYSVESGADNTSWFGAIFTSDNPSPTLAVPNLNELA